MHQDADWVLRVARLCRAAIASPLATAGEHIDEAFVVIDRDGEEEHPVFAELLCTAGDIAFAQAKHDAATALYRRAQTVAAWIGAEADLQRARAIASAATVDIHREAPDRARLGLADALAVLRRCVGAEAHAARAHVEAQLRGLETPDDLRLLGCGACVRVAPEVAVVRDEESQSLYAEASSSDGVLACEIAVDDGRIVGIAESHDGTHTLRLVGTGPSGAPWTVEARGFRCAWPDGTTLRAHVATDSSFEFATEHGGLVIVRGPFDPDTFAALAPRCAANQRVVGEGEVARGTFVDVECTDDDGTWRQRHVRLDDALCVLVSAEAPAEHFEGCEAAMQLVVDSLQCG